MFNGNNSGFSMPVAPIGYGNGNGDWGNDWVALAIIAMIFGWGGMGNWGGMGGMGMFLPFMFGGFPGFNGGCGCGDNNNAIQAAVQRGFDNQTVVTKLDGLNSGLCSLGYDQLAQMNNLGMAIANGFHGVDNAVCQLGYQTQQGFHGVDNAVCTLGYQTQQGFNQTNIALMQGQNAIQTQLAQCCCENRAGQADIKYQMATDTCAIQNTIQNTTRDIIDNNNANTRSVLDFLVNDKISTLQQENQNLKLAASQAAQNTYLLSELKPCPQPAYITCNPFTGQYGGYGYNGYGYNNGCGCNSGCCGCNG